MGAEISQIPSANLPKTTHQPQSRSRFPRFYSIQNLVEDADARPHEALLLLSLFVQLCFSSKEWKWTGPRNFKSSFVPAWYWDYESSPCIHLVSLITSAQIVILSDEQRGFLRNHISGGDDIGVRNYRKYAPVNHAKTSDAVESQSTINYSALTLWQHSKRSTRVPVGNGCRPYVTVGRRISQSLLG